MWVAASFAVERQVQPVTRVSIAWQSDPVYPDMRAGMMLTTHDCRYVLDQTRQATGSSPLPCKPTGRIKYLVPPGLDVESAVGWAVS